MESTAEIIHEIRQPMEAPSLIYVNTNDPRLVVPGPMPLIGWVPNLGNRVFWLISIALVLITILGRRR